MQINEELQRLYTTNIIQQHNKPETWDSTIVEILREGTKIGEYTRNYPNYGKETFHPFEQDGRHYALYSRHYTATRVMTLPDCKDLCGEQPDSFGFCPTGYAVPFGTYETQEVNPNDPEPGPNPRNDTTKWVQVIDQTYCRPGDGNYTLAYTKDEYDAAIKEYDALFNAWLNRNPYVDKDLNGQFGFVCGCIWGDDFSWKIQYLDLSKIKEGTITNTPKFGYIELPPNLGLAQAIDLNNYPYIGIAVAHHFDIRKNYHTTDKTDDAHAKLGKWK